MTSEGIPRSWRLTRASELRAVIDGGHRSRTTRIELFWLPNEHGHPRMAVIVPRYGAGAVARNRLRRRLRELLRRGPLRQIGSTDLVARARAAAYHATPADLAGDVTQWQAALRL